MKPELWKQLPGHPGYALSNQGRLRSPRGLMTPGRTGATHMSVRYQIYMGGKGTQTTIRLVQAMRDVWGIDFVPTDAWIAMVRTEIKAELAAAAKGVRPKPVLPQIQPQIQAGTKPGKPSAAPSGMPCPWAGGLFDTAPAPGVSWDSAEADPLTHRGDNGVWFYVPKSAKERRKIRIEYKKAQREAAGKRGAA